MTDLVSTLADQIMALINAKPRSPTKAEIEAVVLMALERTFPTCRCGRHDTHFDTPECFGITKAQFQARCDALSSSGDGELCPPHPGKAWSSAFVTDHMNYTDEQIMQKIAADQKHWETQNKKHDAMERYWAEVLNADFDKK
jgi:hypothetical protein